MSVKPSDIFIGVIDFFSVMLPGALLTYFLMGIYYADIFGDGKIFPEPSNDAARWIIFLIASYITGNAVFMLAAFLDSTYDGFPRKRLFQSKYDLPFKTARLIREKHLATNARFEELYAGKDISKSEFQTISGVKKLKKTRGFKRFRRRLLVSGLRRRIALRRFLRRRDIFFRNFKPRRKSEIFNTFKWAQHFLLFNKPEALAQVQRIVADSKFFRSLVVAFLIIAVLMFIKVKIFLGVLFIGLAALCYYRYCELRYKSTETAYELIVTYFHLKPEAPPEEVKTVEKTAAETKARREAEPEAAAVRLSELRQNLSEDYVAAHRNAIAFLSKGITKPLKLMTFNRAARQNRTFVSDKNETWFCLRGHGILNCVRAGRAETIFLMPNQIFSVEKESEISFAGGDPAIEILVLEK